jgi:hypothetical protein
MATKRWDQPDNSAAAEAAVVGLFTNANDAERAILELRRAGFSSNQLGAAIRDTFSQSAATGTSNPSTTVKPGAFPETPGFSSATPKVPGAHAETKTNWWERLKHAFGADSDTDTRADNPQNLEAKGTQAARAGAPLEDKTSMNFGTGEGHLGVTKPGTASQPEYEFEYLSSAFENSLGRMGVGQARAGYLARSLSPGYAIVTVNDLARAQEAERILTSNNGVVRYEEAGPPETRSGTNSDVATPAPRIQLFGEVLRVHTGRAGKAGMRVSHDTTTDEYQVRRT